MKNEEKNRIRDAIKQSIGTVEAFAKDDVIAPHLPPEPTEGDRRTISLLLWEAREALREEGIVFAPAGKQFVCAGWKGIENQARRQRQAGKRKRDRAERKLRLAAELAPDADAERLRDMADREALRIALARQRHFD